MVSDHKGSSDIMRIGILGLGNLGSSIGRLIANNGHDVLAWEYDQQVVDEVNRKHCNSRFLAGVQLPVNLIATADINQLASLDSLVITMPSPFIVKTLTSFSNPIASSTSLINLSKGISAEGKTIYQTLTQLAPNNPIALLSGPTIANEVAKDKLTAIVAASTSDVLLNQIELLFSSEYFSVSRHHDPIAVELGGILKNIYALAMGIVVSHDAYGQNFNGAFIYLALKEMASLIAALGGESQASYGLSGLGDLITTALSEDSHNRHMGTLLATGLSVEEIKQQLVVLPEGYNSLYQALKLAEAHGCPLPLAMIIKQRVEGVINSDGLMKGISLLLKTERC